jgi:import receptor subunit TOM20
MRASALTLVGVTLVGGLLAYAAYFDYKRRTDVEFRKKLRMFSTP